MKEIELLKIIFRDSPDILEPLNEIDKEIERLNNIIETANKILSNILVINDKEHEGKYRPIKNTSKNDVYKSICMLYGVLGTPYRSDYGSLQGSDKNE